MFEFQVQSGPLKITIVAETAYDAAVEAVRWWGRRTGGNGSHRRSLEADVIVRPRYESRMWRESFATFNLLAESEDRSPEHEWDRLIDLAVANNN